MKKKFKITLLYILKYLGIFHICRKMTKNGLRILCYHNFSDGDAISFRPQTFISPKTFQRRLDYLIKKKYPVITIETALEKLGGGTLPPYSTVITIDDGWYGIKALAHKQFAERGIPYTVYVTSYYALKGTPIFELVIRYAYWKTKKRDRDEVVLNLAEGMGLSAQKDKCMSDLVEHLIQHGEKKLDHDGRIALMKQFVSTLDVDYDEIVKARTFTLLNGDEIAELSEKDVSIQLHTHRHRWPLDLESAREEISQNKAFLEPLTQKPLVHFCYPNGSWQKEHLPLFEALDLCSATTCDPGLNYKHTIPYALKRFVDGENRSQIEFEAEISGCTDILRRMIELFLK